MLLDEVEAHRGLVGNLEGARRESERAWLVKDAALRPLSKVARCASRNAPGAYMRRRSPELRRRHSASVCASCEHDATGCKRGAAAAPAAQCRSSRRALRAARAAHRAWPLRQLHRHLAPLRPAPAARCPGCGCSWPKLNAAHAALAIEQTVGGGRVQLALPAQQRASAATRKSSGTGIQTRALS